MKQPILTISILVSGKYNNVKKCLDSIQPILNQVPSELILTDTGCDTEVRNLIERYSDNIIDFNWIQDFSAARNAGLMRAKGQWFMYLDDDEWFDDTTDIIRFLLSDELKYYDVALYYQRNYSDEKMTQYMDYAVDRIIRHTGNLHFENKIHEEYTGITVRKSKQLNAFVHHMGYVFKNDEEKKKKYKRNGELLEQECLEKPDNMRLWHQYAVNFWCIEDWDRSVQICKKVIKKENNSPYWDMLHTDLLYSLSMQNNWDESIDTCKEFLNKTLYPYENFGVRQFLVQAYFNKQQFHNVCEIAQKVINTYRYYKRQPNEFEEGRLGGNIYFGEENIGRMLMHIMVSAIHERESSVAKLLCNEEIRAELEALSVNDDLSRLLVGYVLQYGTGKIYEVFLDNYSFLKELLRNSGYYTYLEQCVDSAVESDKRKLDEIVLDSLTFAPDFFEPETRSDFYIESLMKNAWAAQLEILQYIGEICNRHGIKYFVDWGSMLGAVREKGYIPWDDDIDIGMLRDDYRRFSEIIEQYDNIKLCNEYNTPDWGEHAARITTQTDITISRNDIKAHRGFPFPVGVDLFVIDYVPDDDALREEQRYTINQIAAANKARKWLTEHEFSDEEYANVFMQYSLLINWIEDNCNMKFSQRYPTSQEFMILIDEVVGMYGPSDGKMVTQGDCFVSRDNYYISADAYSDVLMFPFENIMVPVPVGYDEILRVKYGDNYMIPVNNGGGHGYPYYNVFVRKLFNLDEEADLNEAREYVKKMASDYYREFISQSNLPTVSIDESYYKDTDGGDEIRRIQAAELEILAEIQRICKKNNLKYYAYGDTLKGVVENKGFLNGSDDLNIAMSREDYKKFLKLTQTELSSWFDYRDVYSNGEHVDMRSYVMSDGYMVSEDDYLERFHGCPHVVAVCVTAIDDISDNKEQENVRKAYIRGLLETAQCMPTEPPYAQEVLDVVEEWRKISDAVINTSVNLKREFVRCADVVAMACKDEQSEYVRITSELQEGIDRIYRREWFEGAIELPFEGITISVPKGYRWMIKEML